MIVHVALLRTRGIYNLLYMSRKRQLPFPYQNTNYAHTDISYGVYCMLLKHLMGLPRLMPLLLLVRLSLYFVRSYSQPIF
jgi:hypothetical protein